MSKFKNGDRVIYGKYGEHFVIGYSKQKRFNVIIEESAGLLNSVMEAHLELYQEPKKKVKLWFWAFSLPDPKEWFICHQAMTREAAIELYGKDNIKKIESMGYIEVEE